MKFEPVLLKYFWILLFIRSAEADSAGPINNVTAKSVCVGKNVTLDWLYESSGKIENVFWSKDQETFLYMIPGADPVPVGGGPQIEHITGGTIKLINVRLKDAGTYSIKVVRSGTTNLIDDAVVTVTESPTGFNHTVYTVDDSISNYTCLLTEHGKPPVQLRIQIGDDLKTGSSFIGDITKSVDCCVLGEAASCIPTNIDKNNKFCKNVYTPYGPDNITLAPPEAEYKLDLGDELNGINCSAECSPPCKYVWDKNGTTIVSDRYLPPTTIHGREDRGTYTCTATRSIEYKQSVSISVYVRYGPDEITLNPPYLQYEVKENDTINDITCQADCYPICSYTWNKNGGQVSPNHTLSLGILQKAENGTYTCTAQNTYTQRNNTHSIIIIIQYGPDFVTLNPADREYTGTETYTISTITCHSECYPECLYKWERLGIEISNNNSLDLGILHRSDTGRYTCIVTNPSTRTSKEATVIVHVRYGPDDAFINHTCQNCTENEGYTLPEIRCQAQCYPICSFSWTKNGTSESSNALLILGRLDKGKAGKYMCTITNPDTQRRAEGSIIVNVRYGPDEITFIPPSTRISLSEGDLFSQKSCTSDCYPGCSQSWTNVDTGRNMGMGQILALGTVYRNNTAEYRCTSTNYALRKSKNDSILLTIKYFPDVKVSKIVEGAITELNESFTIECVPTGFPETYTFFHWTHLAPDGLTKVNEHKGQVVMNTLRLTKEHPSYMDSGVYLCKVTNGERDYPSNTTVALSTLNVTVKGKPLITEIRESKPIVDGATGKHVKLNVSFFSNDGTIPSVTWFKIVNDTRSQLNITSSGKFREMSSDEQVSVRYADNVFVNQSGMKTQLEIANIDEADFCFYETEITNSIGNQSYRLELVPRGPPSLPINFTVIHGSETATSIALMWFPGFHGGASQTFHIEYKTNSTQWKKGPIIPGGKSLGVVNATVRDLLSGTEYTFRLYSRNEYGRMNVSTVVAGATSEVKTAEDQVDSGVIAGAAAGGVALAAIVVLVLLFLRRRHGYLKSPSKTLLKDNERQPGTNEADDTPEINLNPMYESAGPLPSTSNNSNVYSQVDKNRKKANPVGDIYSQVDKPKKRQKSSGSEVKNDVYAQVQKTTNKEKNAGKTKQKKQKTDKITKKGRQTEGDLYDNVDTVKSAITKWDNAYENPTVGTEDEHTQQRNQDGLIYVDLDLPTETVGKDRKAVIHGLDDMTDYADIKFGEVGEQAPESDEENKNNDS